MKFQEHWFKKLRMLWVQVKFISSFASLSVCYKSSCITNLWGCIDNVIKSGDAVSWFSKLVGIGGDRFKSNNGNQLLEPSSFERESVMCNMITVGRKSIIKVCLL